MEQKQKITDEQIAVFLSGTSTEEDKEAVYEYMSESDENFEELMIIAEAIEAQRKADAQEAEKRAIRNQEHRGTIEPSGGYVRERAHRRSIMPLRSFNHVGWRVAASVAVVLVAGSIVFALSNRGVESLSDDGPILAMNTNPQEFPSTGDAENTDNIIIHQPNTVPQSSEIYAEAEPSSFGNSSLWDRHTENANTQNNRRGGNMMAYSQSASNNPKVSEWTVDTEFDIEPDVPEQMSAKKDTVISWNCNMPQKVVLEMGPIDGKWIFRKEFTASQNSVVITSSDLRNLTLVTDTIKWRINAYFDNGRKSPEKNGIIKIEE